MGVNHSQDRTHADPAPDAPLEKNAQPLEVVSLLRSSDGYSRRCGLLKVAQAGRRQTEGSAWAAPYVEAGVIEALVEVTARAQQHEVHEQARTAIAAMHMLLNCLVTGEDAARRFLVAVAQECASPQGCSTALYQLITSALDQPVTCQVAEETGLRETLIAQLLRTLAAQIPLNHQLPPSPLKAGPGENVCSSPGSAIENGNEFTSAIAQQRNTSLAAPVSSGSGLRLPLPLGSQQAPKLKIAPLQLDSVRKSAASGLTRSTRRAGGWSPMPSPGVTGHSARYSGISGQSALPEIWHMGAIAGECLVAADLAALVNQRRKAVALREAAAGLGGFGRTELASHCILSSNSSDSGASTGSGEGGDLLDNDAVAALAGLAPRTAAPQFRLQNASSMPQPSHQRLSLQSLHGPTGIMKRKSLGARSQLSGGRNSSVFRRSIGSSRHRSTDIMVFSTEATEEVKAKELQTSIAQSLSLLASLRFNSNSWSPSSSELCKRACQLLAYMATEGNEDEDIRQQLISLLHWEDAFASKRSVPPSLLMASTSAADLAAPHDIMSGNLEDSATVVFSRTIAKALLPLAELPLQSIDSAQGTARLLGLMADFLEAAEQPLDIESFVHHFQRCLSTLQGSLQSASHDQPGWLLVSAALLDCLAFLAPACSHARCQNQLLQLLFPKPVPESNAAADKQSEPAVTIIERAVIARWTSEASTSRSAQAACADDLEAAVCAVLHLAAALLPVMSDAEDPTFCATARQRSCFDAMLAPLIAVPNGLLLQLLAPPDTSFGAPPGSDSAFGNGGSAALSHSVLRLEALKTSVAIFGSPGSPFVSEDAAMLTLHTHFMHFLRTYNMPGAADADLAVDVTRGHLQVLAAIAKQGSAGVRQRFLQLRVMPYLACQLDAELQAATAPLPAQPSRSDDSPRSVTSAGFALERSESRPASKRASFDVPSSHLGQEVTSAARAIPPLDLAQRGPHGTSPGLGGGALRSSRSSRSITWADGDDSQPAGEATGRDSYYDSDGTPRVPAEMVRGGSFTSLNTALLASARPPAVPSLNLAANTGGGSGRGSKRGSARGPPSGQGAGGMPRFGAGSREGNASGTMSGGRPQTPVQAVPRLALGSGGRAAAPTDILAAAAAGAVTSTGAAASAASGCPPSGRMASGRASSRLGSTPTGQGVLSATPAASPPVAASPTRGVTRLNRQAVLTRSSMELPRTNEAAEGDLQPQGSGGLSQALKNISVDGPPSGGRQFTSQAAASAEKGTYAVATPTAAVPGRANTIASGGASDCSAATTSEKASGRRGASAEPMSPPGASSRHSGSDYDSDASSESEVATPRSKQPDRAPAGASTFPPGFQFTGDLDADVAALEALQDDDWSDDGSGDGSPSTTPREPIIPAAATQARSLQRMGSSMPRGSELVPMLDMTRKASPSAAGSESQPGSELPSHRSGGVASGAASGRPRLRALSAMEGAALIKGKMQAVSRPLEGQGSYGPVRPVDLQAEQAARQVYSDQGLHLTVLQLVLTLLLRPDGSLDPAYADSSPTDRLAHNVPFILLHHLNHPSNSSVVAPLLEWSRGLGEGGPRLMRLLCRCLFNGSLYTKRSRIARGAFAQVLRAEAPALGHDSAGVALKVTDLPATVHDGHALVDVFSEVALLQAFASNPAVCQVWDYGVEGDNFVLVLRRYEASLAQWRASLPSDPGPRLRLYFTIFADVLRAVQGVHAANVVHFDLKCDNVLLAPLPGRKATDMWHTDPAAIDPAFRVVLADFGEGRAFGQLSPGSAVTTRNRGTECVKSPEMLLVANAARKTRDTYDRRRREGAGAASDIWSLGCLLYELVTGQFLFHDPDWIRFFMRVTRSDSSVIPPEREAAVAHLPGLVPLLELMLTRDVRRRPTIPDVLRRVQLLIAQLDSGQLPEDQHREPSSNVVLTPFQAVGEAAESHRGDETSRSHRSRASSAPAEARLPYVTCEYYLHTISSFPADHLWLASLPGLQRPDQLAAASISHVVMLCQPPAAGFFTALLAADMADGTSSNSPFTADSNITGNPAPTSVASAEFAPSPTQNDNAHAASDMKQKQQQQARQRLTVQVLRDRMVRGAVRSCAAAAARCILIPIAPCDDEACTGGLTERTSDCNSGGVQVTFAQQLPAVLSALAALPEGARVCVAAAAGLDGEAAVAAAARLAIVRGVTAFQALVAVSHTRLALHLQERHVATLAAWADTAQQQQP